MRTHALVCAVSFAVLAHQVALLRALAISHWHHAAQLVVAVALCGFGAAGTAIAVFPRLRSARLAHLAAAAYAVSIPVSLGAASLVGFNALAVGWETGQWLRLLLLQAIFLVPMLLGALAIQIPLALAGPRIGALYGTNLVASGLGALGVLPLLSLGPPEDVLRWLALLPAAAAALRTRRTASAAALIVLAWPFGGLEMTRYKSLPAALAHPGAEIVATRYRPTARVDVVRAGSLHHVEGLSLGSSLPVPPQDVVFVDGLAAGALPRGDARYFGDTLAAAPWSFLHPSRVLVLGGAGSTEEGFMAGAGAVRRVDPAWTGENPRRFLATTDERFDVVLLRVPDGVAMSEDALLTVEGVRAALDVCTDTGVVVLLAVVHEPPREGLKVIATARAVTPHLRAARSLDLLAVMLRRTAFGAGEETALARWCAARGFDVVGGGAPRHRSGGDAYARALRGDAGAGRYRRAPATDDSPYFRRFLRWSRLGTSLRESRTLGAAHVDWGTVVALVGAVQVTLLGLLLCVLPLGVLRREPHPPGARRYAVWHFLGIGVAYALVEAAFLGRLTVALAAPEYAAGAVLCAFLCGSGLGSLTGARVRTGAVLAAVLVTLSVPLLAHVDTFPAALLLSAAVAFPMGMPFPGGLRRLDARAASLVPWALAVNGCASVAAFSLSPVLASDVGFGALLLAGAALYAGVAIGHRRA